MENFRFISDNGHGWLAVPRTLLKKLRISKKITPYSYMQGGMAYLEEDCDFDTFARAYNDKIGSFGITQIDVNGDAECRGFARYKP